MNIKNLNKDISKALQIVSAPYVGRLEYGDLTGPEGGYDNKRIAYNFCAENMFKSTGGAHIIYHIEKEEFEWGYCTAATENFRTGRTPKMMEAIVHILMYIVQIPYVRKKDFELQMEEWSNSDLKRNIVSLEKRLKITEKEAEFVKQEIIERLEDISLIPRIKAMKLKN